MYIYMNKETTGNKHRYTSSMSCVSLRNSVKTRSVLASSLVRLKLMVCMAWMSFYILF